MVRKLNVCCIFITPRIVKNYTKHLEVYQLSHQNGAFWEKILGQLRLMRFTKRNKNAFKIIFTSPRHLE